MIQKQIQNIALVKYKIKMNFALHNIRWKQILSGTADWKVCNGDNSGQAPFMPELYITESSQYRVIQIMVNVNCRFHLN